MPQRFAGICKQQIANCWGAALAFVAVFLLVAVKEK